MPRAARIVTPGFPHHVVQRGNRRMQTFFGADDYRRYIDLVAEGCRAADVQVLAYCLMPNHVHLVLVPADPKGLSRALGSAHQKYAWVINRQHGWSGYLWQSRFFSSAMDDQHALGAVAYVELNPVGARMVDAADAWRWSSAKAHVEGVADALVATRRPSPIDAVADWRAFLDAGLDVETIERIRLQTRSGRVPQLGTHTRPH
jgi:putative transposase